MTTPDKDLHNTVSLDGLLSSLGGVEGSIMSRPKAMNTMKYRKYNDTVDRVDERSQSHLAVSTRSVGQDDNGDVGGLEHQFDVEALLLQDDADQCDQEYHDGNGDTGDEFETIGLGDVDNDDVLFGVFASTGDGAQGDDVPDHSSRNGDHPDVCISDESMVKGKRNSVPVFDCLDERMSADGCTTMAQHGGGHQSIDVDVAREQSYSERTCARKQDIEEYSLENHEHTTVSEFGHKAAKALQLGKKWLFATSKNIARDVQSRIDARASRRKHKRQTSIIDSPMSDFLPEEHHRLWAEQLWHAPPETQVAALEAMEEYDRFAVQQVIDEMIWYDKHHNHSTGNRTNREEEEGDDTRTEGGHAKSDTIHSMDVIVGPTVQPERNGNDTIEETFDLLNLDEHGHGADEANSSWEGTLFGTLGSATTKSSTKQFDSTQEQHVPPVEAVEGESDLRRKLRSQRLAREQQRVEEQVAHVRNAEAREASEKEEKIAIRSRLRPEIDAWCAGKKDNIRSLLSTMDMVMWKESPWKTPSVADLIEPGQVRKWYMKANLVVHPDKVKQNHGTLEQLTRAEMIFDVLQHAWGKFS